MHTGQRCETKWFSSLFPSKPVSVKSDRSIIGYLQRFHPLPRHNSSHTSLCLTPFLRKDLEETGWPIALVIITRWERHKPRQGETHQQHWHKNERRSNDRTIWSSVKSPHQPLPQHHFLVHVLCLFPLHNLSALKVLYFTHKWHKVRFIYSTGEVGPGWRSRNSDSLRAGRSGDRMPVEARLSAPIQTGPRVHPASCTMATGFLCWGKAAGERF